VLWFSVCRENPQDDDEEEVESSSSSESEAADDEGEREEVEKRPGMFFLSLGFKAVERLRPIRM
jgi:hypothetical protein